MQPPSDHSSCIKSLLFKACTIDRPQVQVFIFAKRHKSSGINLVILVTLLLTIIASGFYNHLHAYPMKTVPTHTVSISETDTANKG